MCPECVPKLLGGHSRHNSGRRTRSLPDRETRLRPVGVEPGRLTWSGSRLGLLSSGHVLKPRNQLGAAR